MIALFVGEFGALCVATVQRGWDCEIVAVKTVKGTFRLRMRDVFVCCCCQSSHAYQKVIDLPNFGPILLPKQS